MATPKPTPSDAAKKVATTKAKAKVSTKDVMVDGVYKSAVDEAKKPDPALNKLFKKYKNAGD